MRGTLHLFEVSLAICVPQYSNAREVGYHVLEKLKALSEQFRLSRVYPSNVCIRPVVACDKPRCDEIMIERYRYDWDDTGGFLGRPGRRLCAYHNDINL